MKKITIILIAFVGILINTVYAMPETLPTDVGSNAELMEILKPEEDEVVNYSETYLISCLAEPSVEITLYKKLNNSLYIPMTIDDEAITGTVGQSGIFTVDVTFEADSVNEIMFYAEKDGLYQTILKTITIKEKQDKNPVKKAIIDIQSFVSEILR